MFLLKGKGQIVHFAMFYYGKGAKIVQNAMFLVKSCILQCVWGKLVVKLNPPNLSRPIFLFILSLHTLFYISSSCFSLSLSFSVFFVLPLFYLSI